MCFCSAHRFPSTLWGRTLVAKAKLKGEKFREELRKCSHCSAKLGMSDQLCENYVTPHLCA